MRFSIILIHSNYISVHQDMDVLCQRVGRATFAKKRTRKAGEKWRRDEEKEKQRNGRR